MRFARDLAPTLSRQQPVTCRDPAVRTAVSRAMRSAKVRCVVELWPDGKRVPTMVVSSLGAMQQALCATLASFPWLDVVGTAGGGLSALELMGKRPPALVVIDGSVSEDEVLALVRHLKKLPGGVYCMVLAETSRGRRRALDAGADAALLRGSAPEDLRATLQGARQALAEEELG